MPPAGGDFLRDWQAVRDDSAIQFSPLAEPKQPEGPDWLQQFLEWLGELLAPVGHAFNAAFGMIGLSWQIMQWVLLAVVLGFVAWLLIRHFPKIGEHTKAPPLEPDWMPERSAALGLLEDADRLAGAGRFDEATHLLLQRSVAHIAEAHPGLLQPSTTAREISALAALPNDARDAFATIAARVERCLFALRALNQDDWQAARTAYAEFALGSVAGPA